MGIFLLSLQLGSSQGFALISLVHFLAETGHELRRSKVIHLPEAGKDRAGPGVEEAAGESDHIVSLGNLAQSRLASAE